MATIPVLLSENVGKYEFLKGVFPEKGLLEKAATIKGFEYSPLGSQLKEQFDIVKNEFDEKECDKTINEEEKDDKIPTVKRCNKSDLI